MAVFARSKRVTDPLDDDAKARLIQLSYVSSGSEHSAGADDSPSLSDLVHDFLHDHDHDSDSDSLPFDSDSDLPDSAPDFTDSIHDMVLTAANANNADPYRSLLVSHLSMAVQRFSHLRLHRSVLRRNVMAVLRELGHNAAVCKTKWSSSGSVTSGNHEFVDVLRSGGGQGQIRYFVELDLASEFQIARPTVQYSRMLLCLPRIFVGTGDELKRIVRVLCDAARKSLRSTELSVSPWRKNRYVQNKWFGPYRRTINPIPEKSPSPFLLPSPAPALRCVGFDDVVSDVNINPQFFVRTR